MDPGGDDDDDDDVRVYLDERVASEAQAADVGVPALQRPIRL